MSCQIIVGRSQILGNATAMDAYKQMELEDVSITSRQSSTIITLDQPDHFFQGFGYIS